MDGQAGQWFRDLADVLHAGVDCWHESVFLSIGNHTLPELPGPRKIEPTTIRACRPVAQLVRALP